MKKHALVRQPSPLMAQGEITHLERQPVDFDVARRQWDSYVQAFDDAGWTIHEVPAAPEYPDSVFVEDTMVVYDDIAVIGRAGVQSRQGEAAAAEETVRDLGYRICHIDEPGIMDGGDILKFNGTMWVGQTDRTNAAACTQLQDYLGSHGVTVVGVNHRNVLHLKSGVTMLPDGTAVGYEPLVGSWAPKVFDSMLFVPEFSGSHIVILDGDHLLMSANAPKSAHMLRERGYKVTEVDISEFIAMEGCVTCLSVRLRGLPTL